MKQAHFVRNTIIVSVNRNDDKEPSYIRWNGDGLLVVTGR